MVHLFPVSRLQVRWWFGGPVEERSAPRARVRDLILPRALTRTHQTTQIAVSSSAVDKQMVVIDWPVRSTHTAVSGWTKDIDRQARPSGPTHYPHRRKQSGDTVRLDSSGDPHYGTEEQWMNQHGFQDLMTTTNGGLWQDRAQLDGGVIPVKTWSTAPHPPHCATRSSANPTITHQI